MTPNISLFQATFIERILERRDTPELVPETTSLSHVEATRVESMSLGGPVEYEEQVHMVFTPSEFMRLWEAPIIRNHKCKVMDAIRLKAGADR